MTAVPSVAQHAPYSLDVQAGERYFRCRRGRSETQPLCDGSHAGTGFTREKSDARESAPALFCGRKRTGKSPLCDRILNSL